MILRVNIKNKNGRENKRRGDARWLGKKGRKD